MLPVFEGCHAWRGAPTSMLKAFAETRHCTPFKKAAGLSYKKALHTVKTGCRPLQPPRPPTPARLAALSLALLSAGTHLGAVGVQHQHTLTRRVLAPALAAADVPGVADNQFEIIIAINGRRDGAARATSWGGWVAFGRCVVHGRKARAGGWRAAVVWVEYVGGAAGACSAVRARVHRSPGCRHGMIDQCALQ